MFVPIHLVEEHGDCVLFVMALVDGTTLRERVEARGPLSSAQAARLMQEVAWALSLAHSRGIVHRDIKPDNVMLDKATGRAMVTDFGIAQTVRDTESASGEVVGTAHYMSPEQALGEPVDGRSDLYSLGVTAYYALTGTVPFEAPSVAGILAKHITEPAPSVGARRPGLPGPLLAIVAQLLEKDAAGRYASGQQLADAIDAAGLGETAIPASVRLFRAAAISAGTEFGAYTVVLWLMSGWHTGQADAQFSIDFFRFSLLLPLGALMSWRVARLWSNARDVLREGLDHTDVRKALAADGRSHTPPTPTESTSALKAKRYFQRPIPELALAGVATFLLPRLLDLIIEFLKSFSVVNTSARIHDAVPLWVSIPSAIGFLLIIASLLPLKWNGPAIRALPFWSAFWSGGFGRWFFRVASRGLRTARPAIGPSDAPVETMISHAAASAFAALSTDEQARLAELPAVVSQLERQVALLHNVNMDEAPRRASAVAALERLRLDLVRLTVRETTVDDLTVSLLAARELSEEINRILAARREVSELLRPGA